MSFIGKKILNTTKFYLGKYFTTEETIKTKNDKEGVIKKNIKYKKEKNKDKNKNKNKKEESNSSDELLSNIKNEIKQQNIQDANNKNNKKKVSS